MFVLIITWFHIDWIIQYSFSSCRAHYSLISKYKFFLCLLFFLLLLFSYPPLFFFLEKEYILGSMSWAHLLSPKLCSCSPWCWEWPAFRNCSSSLGHLSTCELGPHTIYQRNLSRVTSLNVSPSCPYLPSSIPQAAPTFSSAWTVTEVYLNWICISILRQGAFFH